MDIATVKEDVWGREVLLGVSWDLLWVVGALALAAIVVHLLIMAIMSTPELPSAEGRHLERHEGMDRGFHWIMTITVFVLLFTGVLPVIGIDFSWLTIHWIAGIILTAAIGFHVFRSIFWQRPKEMWVDAQDFQEPFGDSIKPGKYSLAQKGMHHAMTILVLLVIGTGLVLFAVIDTPWWSRSNALAESTLGWTFLLHGLSTLGLIGLIALHVYFSVRPERRFYTRSMISGWISEDEHRANHDPGRWSPDKSA
ncbi:MAG: cytochrome b/b6 domain-containing protein [Pseudomonadales bacterium]